MKIEIENRCLRGRHMGRPLTVASLADRRLRNVTHREIFVLPETPQAIVLPRRRHQPLSAGIAPVSAGRVQANLRPGQDSESHAPVAGFALDTKD